MGWAVGWVVFFALILLALGTPRSWRRIWKVPATDAFWQPRPGVPITAAFVQRARRLAIPTAAALVLLAIGFKFPSLTLACAIVFVAGPVPLAVSIELLRSPRFLVPPPLRDQRTTSGG